MPPAEKRAVLFSFTKEQHSDYPAYREKPFTILYGTRTGENMEARFFLYVLSWTGVHWEDRELEIASPSRLLGAWGSGDNTVSKWLERWQRTKQAGGTSRAVFSAFCDALGSGEDPNSGGPPQLVAIYRTGNPVQLGIVFGGKRYFAGVEIVAGTLVPGVEWRNALFERCDPLTGNRLENAQQHAHPKGLGRNA